MFSIWTPMAVRKPIQNWCVLQTLSTRGMPTRSRLRSGAEAGRRGSAGDVPERVLPNQVRHVGESMLGPLHLRLDDTQLVDVLHQALRAGVVHDHALPARAHGHAAPGPSGA